MKGRVLSLTTFASFILFLGDELHGLELAKMELFGDAEMNGKLQVVHTTRLTLRPFHETDVDPLYAIMGDAVAMQYTYQAPSREACAHRLRTYGELDATLGYAPWTVLLRSDIRADETVIGWGGLNIDPFDPGWGIEVAYCLHPAHWGKGYASELVRASLDLGFGALALETIGAFVSNENGASRRVLEKNGFRFLRYEPQLDRDHFEILRGEWVG